jgi:hypothetical protein
MLNGTAPVMKAAPQGAVGAHRLFGHVAHLTVWACFMWEQAVAFLDSKDGAEIFHRQLRVGRPEGASMRCACVMRLRAIALGPVS